MVAGDTLCNLKATPGKSTTQDHHTNQTAPLIVLFPGIIRKNPNSYSPRTSGQKHRRMLLGIDVGRRNERGGCGLNEGIFQCKYAGDGGTKPRSGNNRYENQNKVKQKTGIAVSPVAVKPYPQHSHCFTDTVA